MKNLKTLLFTAALMSLSLSAIAEQKDVMKVDIDHGDLSLSSINYFNDVDVATVHYWPNFTWTYDDAYGSAPINVSVAFAVFKQKEGGGEELYKDGCVANITSNTKDGGSAYLDLGVLGKGTYRIPSVTIGVNKSISYKYSYSKEIIFTVTDTPEEKHITADDITINTQGSDFVRTSSTTGDLPYNVTITDIDKDPRVSKVIIYAVTYGEKELGHIDVENPTSELTGTMALSELNSSSTTDVWFKVKVVNADGGQLAYKEKGLGALSTESGIVVATPTIAYDITKAFVGENAKFNWTITTPGEGWTYATDITYKVWFDAAGHESPYAGGEVVSTNTGIIDVPVVEGMGAMYMKGTVYYKLDGVEKSINIQGFDTPLPQDLWMKVPYTYNIAVTPTIYASQIIVNYTVDGITYAGDYDVTYDFYMDGAKVATETKPKGSIGGAYYFNGLAPGTKYDIHIVATSVLEGDNYRSDWEQMVQTSGEASSINTVYFDNSASNWGVVKFYVWNDQGVLTNWPGADMRRVSEEGNIWEAQIDSSYSNILFNNGGMGSQTLDLVVINGCTYSADSKAVTIIGAFNKWSESANRTFEIKENKATIVVPNMNGDIFKVTVNYTGNNPIWWGDNGSMPSIGSIYYPNEGGGDDMTLEGISGTQPVKFTISLANEDKWFLAEVIDGTPDHIEWANARVDETSTENYIDIYKDNRKTPIFAYVCNAAGERLYPCRDLQITSSATEGVTGEPTIDSNGYFDASNVVISGTAKMFEYIVTANYSPAVVTSTVGNRVIRREGGNISSDLSIRLNNSPIVTEIETITVEDGAPVRWFNLSGMEIAAPEEGKICIRLQNGQAEKVMIR